MGSFTFKWEHPAEEVYVTGTFDSWTKSVKLDKEGNVFQKSVELKDASEKIYYKFVVDGSWVVNESAPKEPDHEGNVNNFLTPEQITPAAAIINSITPLSTTAAMAAEQPVETKPAEIETKVLDEKPVEEKAVEIPVETKLAEEAAEEKPVEEKPAEDKAVEIKAVEEQPAETKSVEVVSEPAVEPKETPSDIPGGFPITPATELDKPISINPLPAAEGAVNPEKVPESIEAQDINKHVKLDKESYENGSALSGIEAELPPVSDNMIPESSLPVVDVQDVTITTVTPTATTAVLAAEVPLEGRVETPEVKGTEEETKIEEQPKEEVKESAPIDEAPKDVAEPAKEVPPEVPAEVKESIVCAGESPEVAAIPEVVEEKKVVEAELLKDVKPVLAETETKLEEVKPEEAKAEEFKPEETKTEQTKHEETKTEETKPDEAKTDEVKPEETKTEETKPDEAKSEEVKSEEVKPEETKTEETKTEEAVPSTENGATTTENGSKAPENGTKAPEATANGSTSKEAKKKHRISTLISKIKAKFN